MDTFEYSESDVLYTQLSLFQKFMKRHSLDKMTALRLFKENEVFEPSGFLKKIIPFRKNEVHCGISLKEFPIDIKHTSGILNIPLITKEDIYEKMKKIPLDQRKKIRIHSYRRHKNLN